MPSSSGRCSAGTALSSSGGSPEGDHRWSDVGEGAVGKDRTPVHPLTVIPYDPPPFHHAAGRAVVAEVPPELDDPPGVKHPPPPGLEDVQADPAHPRVTADTG